MQAKTKAIKKSSKPKNLSKEFSSKLQVSGIEKPVEPPKLPEKPSTFEGNIDGQYTIVKRFDDSVKLKKQVYLVKNSAGQLFVIKLFTKPEFGVFVAEVERNNRVQDSEHVI